jgi:hypothetical protein
MSRSRIRLSGSLAIALAVVSVACSPSSTTTSQTPAARQAAVVNRPVPNVCERKIVAPDDLVSVLPGTITVKTLPGDPQTCEFSADGYSSVSITVRPGLGDVTVSEWTGGKMPVDAGNLSGIGDRAAWQSTLKELIATKRNVLCDIGSQGTKGTEADLQKKFGQLCDKIWAAQ